MTLYAIYLFAALNQAAKGGTNVTVLLYALSLHAPSVVVGVLVALSGLLPMLFAVSIGRLNDRFGARAPMFGGAALAIVSILLPVIWPGLPALFITAALGGLGTTAFAISSQSVTGHFGGREDRAKNFSWLSMTFSFGGIVGPMIAGRAIDLTGHSGAFLILASLPVLALVSLASGRLVMPQAHGTGSAGGAGAPAPSSLPGRPGRASSGARSALDLLRNPALRGVYLLTSLHVSAWEVFNFLVPLYGVSIGLSATSIGVILSSFSAASFLVRVLLPYFSRRFPPLRLIRLSLVLAGALFLLFPLAHSVLLLSALAFTLGMGIGVTQPLAMSVLHESAPDGRTGEAVGLRTAIVNLSAATTPVVYGALGSAIGMTPLFWGLAVGLWGALWALR